MWRALFLAIGIYLCILGAECLVLDKAVLKQKAAAEAEDPAAGASLLGGEAVAVSQKEVRPKDWMPWSLLSTGAVVILYSFTIPKRVHG